MKIRTNFVSNSSSSSFIIMVEAEEFAKAIKESFESEKTASVFANECIHTNRFSQMNLFDKNIYMYTGWKEHGEDEFFFNVLSNVLSKVPANQKYEEWNEC